LARPATTATPSRPAALAPPPTVTARAAALRSELDRRVQQSASDRAALLQEIDARDRLASRRNRRARRHRLQRAPTAVPRRGRPGRLDGGVQRATNRPCRSVRRAAA
jgi:hypothetical protein